MQGSVSRFLYDATKESFTPNPKGEITGNGMADPCCGNEWRGDSDEP